MSWPSPEPEFSSLPTPAVDETASPPEPAPEQAPIPETPPGRSDGWSLVVQIPGDGMEPPATFTETEAQAVWAAVSAPWHPALLAQSRELPRVESVDSPSTPAHRELRLVAAGFLSRLPGGYVTQACDAGAVVLEVSDDRATATEQIRAQLEGVASVAGDDAAAAALDFLALGTTCWWLRDLATAMGHGEGPDRTSLAREVLNGATSWAAGDVATARNHLRAAFEILTQARERFYPVDAYIIDLCLLDPVLPAGSLDDPLATHTPVTFLAPAQAIEAQTKVDPDAVARLREAISEGWVDVIGGAYAEVDEPLLPLESLLWQFVRGSTVYREHLEGRNVETVARRRFALYPQLPQLAKRFGFRFAYHMGFDAGRFPVRPEAKRLWESPDHSNLETLTRPPLGADRALPGLNLPWRLALTMKDDHVATLPLAHWPSPVAGWYLDLRRAASYSPVLARSVTVNDYFHLTDRPYETFKPEPDAYITPYLAQAVARKDPTPISGRVAHTRLRSRIDALATARALAQGLAAAAAPGTPTDGSAELAATEQDLETGRLDAARASLAALEPIWAGALAKGVAGSETGGRAGYLVLNPIGVPRRAAVLLPGASADLRPEGPLRVAQFTDEGVWAIVDLPAFGFAWVPRETSGETPPAPKGSLSVRERVLKNESLVAEIDANTGGIRRLMAVDEDTARLGQQLVIAGLIGPDSQPVNSRMKADGFQVDFAGPALSQVTTTGAILGPGDRSFARFTQRYRLWAGRPILEIDVAISDIAPTWLERLADADPWDRYLACRWAWPDPNSMLRRSLLLAPELTEAERPETPDALDISTRRQRTAVLFGGLAHHRRHGPRMLDTLLLAGRESVRSFRLGVALDLEYPFHASADLDTPALVVATETGPPRSGPTGWLFQLDSRAVAITRVDYVEATEEGRGWGLVFHMLETSGQSVRCRLRTFRPPTWARQTDFLDGLIVDLTTEGDAVLIDLTANELARVVVTLG